MAAAKAKEMKRNEILSNNKSDRNDEHLWSSATLLLEEARWKGKQEDRQEPKATHPYNYAHT